MRSEILSIAESTVGVLVLLGANLYFYRSHRDRSLLLWSLGWSVYALRLVLTLIEATVLEGPEMVAAIQLATLVSGYYILAGGLQFVGKAPRARCKLAFGIAGLWVAVGISVEAPFWAAALPAWLTMGIAQGAVGVIFLRQADAGFGGRVAGVSLILWGIHKLNYPFLRNVDAFAPIGFTLGSLLALGVGIGLLMAYLDQLQSRSRTSENRFRALVSSIEDLVITADLDGRVVNVYGGWFERHGMPEEWLHARDVTDILDHRHDETVSNEIMRAGTGETRHITLDVELDGRLRWLAFTVSPLRDSHDTIASVVAVGRDVTDQEESRRMLAERLQENQTLLQEVHHRVKNNMQIMSSLLSLQSAQLKHPADRALIAESSRRIDTMAQVHEQLYSADSLSDIAMNPYVNDLAERLVQTYALDGRTVRLIVDVDEIQLPIDRAIPCAQLLHEVITNALKHGFREREQGTLHIVFRTDGESHVRLRVHDDGHGIKVCDGRPASMTTGTTTGTLGLKLVELLARQLDGVATFTNTYGTTFEISFPLEIPHA